MIRNILLLIAFLLIAIQFIRPARNVSGDTAKDISTLYQVPGPVSSILERSCSDCHSNKTIYPWYAELQPVGWWLNNHVVDGKRHFNLNNFAALKVAVQKKKLEEFMDQIRNDDMPLSSYTLVHTQAKLSEPDKQTIYSWCKNVIDTLTARYPPDSLIMEKQKWD